MNVQRTSLRKKTHSLHKKGMSYSQISEKLKIPKSTLSTWLGASSLIPRDKSRQLIHLARARILATEAKKQKRLRLLAGFETAAKSEAKMLPVKNKAFLKALLSMLYWAEGAKHKGVSGLKFVNTDPRLAFLYITLLRKAFLINEARLRIRIHLHHYHDRIDAIQFWSELLQVPSSQFGKIYVKKRSKQRKFRQNFTGICFINYLDSNTRKELLALAGAIEKNITGSKLPSSFNG